MSRRQKSKQRILSVLNCFARAMQAARTSSCFLKSAVAAKESFWALNLERGAPGQSTLKSGLAMSVTRRLYLARMACARVTSSELRSAMFLPHRARISTHWSPNSFEATEHAWSKSGDISSVMTLSLKGEFACARARLGQAKEALVAATAKVASARNVRRVCEICKVPPNTSVHAEGVSYTRQL